MSKNDVLIETLAEEAYKDYNEATAKKWLAHNGGQVPSWEKLEETETGKIVKEKWRASVRGTVKRTFGFIGLFAPEAPGVGDTVLYVKKEYAHDAKELPALVLGESANGLSMVVFDPAMTVPQLKSEVPRATEEGKNHTWKPRG